MTEEMTLVLLGIVAICTLVALYISRPTTTTTVVAQHIDAIDKAVVRTVHAPVAEAWMEYHSQPHVTHTPKANTEAWRTSVDDRIARMSGGVL